MSRLIAVTGPMASGKSSYLCGVLDKARLRCERTGKRILAVKPAIDTRDSSLRSRTGQEYHDVVLFESLVSLGYSELGRLLSNYEIAVVDEINLIEDHAALEKIIDELLLNGLTVYAAGLDTDFRGEPFETTSRILCLADEVEKLSAVCDVCGDEATRTQRLRDGKPVSRLDPLLIVDDGTEVTYEPRCRKHHKVY